MKNKKKENSVRSLRNLYTVIIGVALTLAVVSLIDPVKGLVSITFSSGLLFLAFIATLFPFYHGALRHLDDAYIENDSSHIKDGALIIDFMLLCLHGITFVVLSLLMSKPNHFAWTLSLVLFIDVIWGVFVFYGSSSTDSHNAEGKWALINFCFVCIIVVYLFCNDIGLKTVSNPQRLSLIIAVTCMCRSVVDYVWCRSFYFPQD